MLKTALSQATQDFIPIKEIRDGVCILKDGSLRMALLASSINFALKSADEQAGIIMQYQNFLNSLDFSIQIFMESRKLDIDPYIQTLEKRLKEQPNDLIKTQTGEYIEFIKNFTDNVNVMSKTFFIIVPYDVSILQSNAKGGGLLSSVFGKKKQSAAADLASFTELKTQLEQRAAVVQQGLSRIGVRLITLGTEELVELYFKAFNPGERQIPDIYTKL